MVTQKTLSPNYDSLATRAALLWPGQCARQDSRAAATAPCVVLGGGAYERGLGLEGGAARWDHALRGGHQSCLHSSMVSGVTSDCGAAPWAPQSYLPMRTSPSLTLSWSRFSLQAVVVCSLPSLHHPTSSQHQQL